MNSLDCALVDLHSSIPIIYLRLIFSMTIPFIYLLIFLLGIIGYNFIKKQKNFQYYILSTATMFLIIYFQPDLVSQTIGLISCRKIGDISYILSNVSYECLTDEYKQYTFYLTLPLLLIWSLFLPLLLFFLLKSKKNQLDSIETRLRYGFLYKEYTNNSFYWEFVKMTEKISIILILNFYSQKIVTKGILVFIIITIYGILSFIIKPYKEIDVNQIDINTTNVCAVTILLGVFMYDNDYEYFVYLSLALIIIINLLFTLHILKKIMEGYSQKLMPVILPVLNKLSKRFKIFASLENYLLKQRSQKKFNPIIKQRMQYVFQKYLNMEKYEKKKFILKIVESQLEILFINLNIKAQQEQFSEGQQQNELILKNGIDIKQFPLNSSKYNTKELNSDEERHQIERNSKRDEVDTMVTKRQNMDSNIFQTSPYNKPINLIKVQSSQDNEKRYEQSQETKKNDRNDNDSEYNYSSPYIFDSNMIKSKEDLFEEQLKLKLKQYNLNK